MACKYATDTYLVRFFGRCGTRLRDLPAVNYGDAYDLGYSEMGDGSFVILRVLHNSLDVHPTGRVDQSAGPADA